MTVFTLSERYTCMSSCMYFVFSRVRLSCVSPVEDVAPYYLCTCLSANLQRLLPPFALFLFTNFIYFI